MRKNWSLRNDEICYVDPIRLDGINENYCLVNPSCLSLIEMENLPIKELQKLNGEDWKFIQKAKLPVRQTQCLWLRYWKNMKQKEAALILSCSPQNISQTLKRAQKRLKNHFAFASTN